MSDDALKRSQASLDPLLYPRHFPLLAGFSVLVGLTRLPLSTDLSASFALYGALHASALILALRGHQPIWRRWLFISMAAALSAMTVHVGIIAGQLSGTPLGGAALYAVLGLSAMTGAVTYGILIRLFGIYALSASSLTVIAIGCLLATYAAFFALSHIHWLGRWWLAVFWWHAFSGGLWYVDSRHD